MHAMNAWKDEARVQHFACLALSNFAHDDSNKVAIGAPALRDEKCGRWHQYHQWETLAIYNQHEPASTNHL